MMCNLKEGIGLSEIIAFIEREGLLDAIPRLSQWTAGLPALETSLGLAHDQFLTVCGGQTVHPGRC